MSEPGPTIVRPTPSPPVVDETAAHVLADSTSVPNGKSDHERTSVSLSGEHIIDRRAETVSGFDLLGELGRGGMGVVYRARQTKLNREVALKMILSGEHAGEKDIIRFLAEAESLAAIKHEHVVQVYEYGESNGRPYIALEFCDGGSLADRLKTGRFAPRDAAELVGKIARGVAAAHNLGIVHRDLKPANVLLDSTGQPKVTDFGLAKRAAGAELTQTNAVMGTPSYMSPEQAKGETKFVGPQADVWALGVILYECLTGTKPFVGDDSWTVIKAVIETEPVSPRKQVPGLPRDLALVCLKCLSKEPNERYSTAKELAADLKRWSSGEPVTVRGAGMVERLAKWVRRKPTHAAAYFLTFATLFFAGLTAGAAWLWQDAIEARSEAARVRDGFARERNAFIVKHYVYVIDHAYREYQAGHRDRAMELLQQCSPEHRHWEWEYVRNLCETQLPPIERSCELKGHEAPIIRAAIAPDGKRAVTADGKGVVRVWDAVTGKIIATLHKDRMIGLLDVSPDSRSFVLRFDSPLAWVINSETGGVIAEYSDLKRTPTYSKEGLLIVEQGESVSIVALSIGATVARGRPNDTEIRKFEWFDSASSRDGKRRVSSSGIDWGIESRNTGGVYALPGSTNLIRSGCFSPDGNRIFIIGTTGWPHDTARVLVYNKSPDRSK